MKRFENISKELVGNLSILGFLISIFISSMTLLFAGDYENIECVIMYLVLFVPLIFCVYKIMIVAFALTGIQILLYTMYKVYMYVSYNEAFSWISYVWIFIPIVSVGCMYLFITTFDKLEMINQMLRQQVSELVMVNPITGLYNQRVLFQDLNRQMSSSKRYDNKISLMIVKLKYEQELKSILSNNQYQMLLKVMGDIVEDALRIEDRLYSIDEDGSLALLLICDKTGCEVVKGRLKEAIARKDAFKDVIDKAIKIDVRIGYLEYDQELYQDAFSYFNKVESELQYDV